MGHGFPTEASTSLLRWRQRPDVSVNLLVAACSNPQLESLLAQAVAAATNPLQGLNTAVILGLFNSAASLLAVYTSLTSCILL